MAKLRVGMIGGGGPGNFFGMVHTRAISIDASRELVAGALRSDAKAALARSQGLWYSGLWQLSRYDCRRAKRRYRARLRNDCNAELCSLRPCKGVSAGRNTRAV